MSERVDDRVLARMSFPSERLPGTRQERGRDLVDAVPERRTRVARDEGDVRDAGADDCRVYTRVNRAARAIRFERRLLTGLRFDGFHLKTRSLPPSLGARSRLTLPRVWPRMRLYAYDLCARCTRLSSEVSHPKAVEVPVEQAPATAPLDDLEGPPIPRSRRRSRRRHAVGAVTINARRIPKREIEIGRALYPESDDNERRPTTRDGCVDAPRPCPFVSCKHHLYLDVSERGSIKLNFPDLEPDELVETCSLDVASRSGESLEEVGAALNITRERVRQVELRAIAKLARSAGADVLREFAGVGRTTKRRLPMLPPEEGFDAERFASDELAEE